jgi:tetratricopeptide (TPR) repeat protein
MKRTSVFLPAIVAVLAMGPLDALAQDKAAPKPPTISKAVAKPLTAAQAATKEEKWADCLANARLADAVPAKTPYDIFVINEMIGFCAVRVGDNAAAAGAFEQVLNSGFADAARSATLVRVLMQLSYTAKDYPKAISWGKRAIQEGSANDEVRLLVAQSYYLQNDFKGTLEYTQGWVGEVEKAGGVPPELSLQMYLSSCIRLDDDACTLRALEKQAQYHPKPETWSNIVVLLLREATDETTLHIYRLANEVGAMRRGEDYLEMGQLALEKGLPGEAQAVLEAGVARQAFTDPRNAESSARMLATAKTQAASDKATIAKQTQAAAAGKSGQVDVRMGQALMSYGQYPEALLAIQRGITKGVKNQGEAQLALGQAQLKLGNKAEAVTAFNAVDGDAMMQRVGKLWALHAQR